MQWTLSQLREVYVNIIEEVSFSQHVKRNQDLHSLTFRPTLTSNVFVIM